jgi:serine/threonine protein kinase
MTLITLYNYNTDLFNYINNNGLLESTTCKIMCFKINLGLFYINSKGYVYGDLKKENVCLKHNDINNPVIIDLGSIITNNFFAYSIT